MANEPMICPSSLPILLEREGILGTLDKMNILHDFFEHRVKIKQLNNESTRIKNEAKLWHARIDADKEIFLKGLEEEGNRRTGILEHYKKTLDSETVKQSAIAKAIEEATAKMSDAGLSSQERMEFINLVATLSRILTEMGNGFTALEAVATILDKPLAVGNENIRALP